MIPLFGGTLSISIGMLKGERYLRTLAMIAPGQVFYVIRIEVVDQYNLSYAVHIFDYL